LGLAAPNERCTTATVEGWQIEVVPAENESQSYFYRTNLTRNIIRFSSQDNNLSPSVSDRLLQSAAHDQRIPASELTVSDTLPKLWDGCLGIYQPGAMCTAIGILGWQAIVTDGSHRWIYHLSGDGSEVQLNAIASLTSTLIQPNLHRINATPLPEHVVFVAIKSGGFAGLTSAIRLLASEQVEYLFLNADVPQAVEVIRQLSPEQMQEFTSFLEQHQFRNFNGVSYQPPAGAADFFTVILVSLGSITEYADIIQTDLPEELQQIIQEWEAIARAEAPRNVVIRRNL
jgi:hypothetical protein